MDEWKWWRDALEGKVDARNLNEANPQTGYYRTRPGLDAVAYWKDSHTGEQRCQVNGKDVSEARALELWEHVSKNFVTGEFYKKKIATGKWPDEFRSIGDNNPPGDTPEVLIDRLDDLEREANEMLKNGVTNDDVCNQISDHAKRFLEVEKQSEALRKVEKAPHEQAAKAVDGKWRGVIDRAKALKDRLNAAITPYMKRRDEEKRRREIEAATKGEPIPEIRSTAGTVKRSTALRTYYRARVDDRRALHDSLVDHPEMVACAQSIADAAARKQIALAGCTVISEKRAA